MDQANLFERNLLKQRAKRALERQTAGMDFLFKAIADDLGVRLSAIQREFGFALDLGGHAGHISAMLRASGKADTIIRADLFHSDPALPPPDLVLDDEFLPFGPGTLDLIVAGPALCFVNDLPGVLMQIRKALRPDGLFLASIPGSGTLQELRDVLLRTEIERTGGGSPRVSPFADTRDLGALLQRAGFALPVADVDLLTVRYDTIFNLMADLRAMGATSVLRERPANPVSKDFFIRAGELYALTHADPDGRIRATISVVSLSGWAPHESQQKPLRPGSAKSRLADALGAKEVKLGETRSEKSSGR
ncbi:SAM-dependent methyltransferase [Roseibium aquae]|uniref:SAM-dependent methyltransferase n=2 Tax=Roseibium aquae TaxID=1323746 RepID=A0A916TN65_9HYPH|nr:methyltransferase domain-containing protein [Roseibium aquae]GGB61476.1 SAM-dependent methyltransferase [Roseibium aquae]